MDRKFFSNKHKCGSNCKYCFEKWDSYEHYETFDVKKICRDSSIIYPNCDGDFFDYEFDSIISDLCISDYKLFISVSTKNGITDKQFKKILELNNYLIKKDKGFVKISISFSCSNSINVFEERTLSYYERLELIKRISGTNLKYVTIIKPILPFIPFNEYKRLIDDIFQYSNNFIIGQLYVNTNSEFYHEFIKGKYKLVEKNVSWAKNSLSWKCVEDDNLYNQIKNYVISKQGHIFKSDVEYFESIFE